MKQNPENDDPLRYKALKFLPGNFTYASVTNKGKKILSDSLCSGIKLHEFNHYIKNGYAYCKLFTVSYLYVMTNQMHASSILDQTIFVKTSHMK